jgi:hypothetical protein
VNDDRRIHAVIRLWAVACLSNLLSHADLQHGLDVLLLRVLLFGLAFHVAMRPATRQGNGFALLAAGYAGLSLYDLARVNNHGTVMLFVHLCIVGIWCRARLQRAAVLDAWRDALLPLFRGLVAILYFWAVFHKLNEGFLDPLWSCASSELEKLALLRPFGISLNWIPHGPAARLVAIYGTLLVEAAIPLLLFIRRTRFFGALLAILFHTMLGLSYPAFSVTLWALVAAFFPGPTARILVEKNAADDKKLLKVVVPGTILLAVVLWWAHRHDPSRSAVYWSLPLLRHLFLVWTIWMTMRILPRWWSVREAVPDCEAVSLRRAPQVTTVLLLVAALGLAPYLGLWATRSFAMYSNLEVSSGESNHLIVPAGWQQLFDRRSSLVFIVGSSDPILDALAEPGWIGTSDNSSFSTYSRAPLDAGLRKPPRWGLPEAAFRHRMARVISNSEGPVQVVWEQNGQVFVVQDAGSESDRFRLPFWQRKLVRFRAVPQGAEGLCMW